MGHNSNVKLLRKQIRNVAQEQLPGALTNEVLQSIQKDLMEFAGKRLDTIAENTNKALERQDKQTGVLRKQLMLAASQQIAQELLGISSTMLAWQRVLCRRLGITDMTAFDAEVNEEQKLVMQELEAEAKAKEEAEAAAAKAAEEAKAAEAPKIEEVSAPAAETAQE